MYIQIVIFQLLYGVVCSLYLIVTCTVNFMNTLNHKFKNFYYVSLNSSDEKYISTSSKKITKIPTHLTVILGNEAPSCKDLANIVIWSILVGIPFISFYDSKGILKKMELKLSEEIDKRKPEDSHVLWFNNADSYKNGFTGKKIRVRTLSDADGRQSVVDLTKRLCNKKLDEIDQHLIDSNLKDSFVFPDPELGLHCGQPFSIYGYPPWQIRTTEFFCIDTHHDVKPYTFVDLLCRYSKTEQRLGK